MRPAGGWLRWAVALLNVVFVLGAYLDARARLAPASHPGPWSDALLDAAWLALMGLVATTLALGLRRGGDCRLALPAGYHLVLLGGVLFGLGALADVYWQAALGFGQGLEALLAPTHLLELAGGGLMVAAPLNQALRDRPERVDWPVILSAATSISALTFLTQFANPLVTAGPAAPALPSAPSWVGDNLAAGSILIQTSLLVGLLLLLARSFALPPGSLTVVGAVNGLCLALISSHPERGLVLPVTGLVADALLPWLQARPASMARLRIFSVCVPTAYVLGLWAAVGLTEGGAGWRPRLWIGMLLAAALTGFLVSYVAGIRRPPSVVAAEALADRWPQRRVEVTADAVKEALEVLDDPAALAGSPLARLACIGGGGAPALRDLLTDVLHELAGTTSPRDAEAGRLLVDYYLKRVGSHEVIAERLHLSRPTFYRRLQRGLALVADRLEELSQLAARVGVPPAADR